MATASAGTERDAAAGGGRASEPDAAAGGARPVEPDVAVGDARPVEPDAAAGAARPGEPAAASTVRPGAPSPRLHLDPRAKLYVLLLANLMLFFHARLHVEVVMVTLFLAPFFVSGRVRAGLRLAIIYLVLLGIDAAVLPAADAFAETGGTGGAAAGFVASFLSMLSVGIRMLLPCIITGAYAFTTTTVGEFVCALRRMRVPETVIIPCMVVIRFFPTIREDYRQIRNAMALRGIAAGSAGLLRNPAQSLEYILMPLLMNSNNVVQDLSVAALTKGIGLPGAHTCMTEIRMTALDWAYMAVCTVPLAAFIGGLW